MMPQAHQDATDVLAAVKTVQLMDGKVEVETFFLPGRRTRFTTMLGELAACVALNKASVRELAKLKLTSLQNKLGENLTDSDKRLIGSLPENLDSIEARRVLEGRLLKMGGAAIISGRQEDVDQAVDFYEGTREVYPGYYDEQDQP